MPRGGKRTGAGRKQGFAAKNAEEARKVFSERVAAEIGPIADALIEKAKKGEVPAIRELLDRAWGRPQQMLRVETESNPSLDVSDEQYAKILRNIPATTS